MKKLELLLILLLVGCVGFAQTRQLNGTVRDSASGRPLPSTTVKVVGKNTTAVTGADGTFSLIAPLGSVSLQVTSVGYAPQTINVDPNDNNLIIQLSVSSARLQEVVVTALGISKEARKVGYAVTTVNGDLLNKARETNVALSLSGRVAGLNVHGTNGGPGGTARILLRGMPSMNSGGAPLFVLNGVPIDNTQRGNAGEWGGSDNGDGIGNLNPDDIETMTVLKGQSASALYGSRASNGVILITTKTGKKGNFAVDYNTNYSIDKAINYTDYQYVYGQGQNGNKPTTAAEAQNTGRLSWGAKLDGSQVIQFDGKTYAYSPYKDNIANFYRTAPSFTNTVAVTSGGDRGSFRLSLSNLDNKSIIRNSGINRKTANLNLEQRVTDKLKINVVANYIDEQSKNRPQLSDGPMNANNGLFLANNINEAILAPGYDPANNGRETRYSDDEYVTNPWFVVNQYINNLSRKRLISAVTARYTLTDWLYAQGRVGYDLLNDRAFSVTPWGTAYSQGFKGGLNDLSQSQTSELNIDGLIGATRHITQDLGLDVAVGANLRKNQFERTGVNGGPFVLPYLYSYSNVVNYGRSYGFSKKEVHSAYYTVDLSYKNILTLNTTGRYDAYSTLPSSNRSIFTPSVSASFVFSELTNIKDLSFGKIRASFAQTSGEPGNPYQTSIYYGVGNSLNGIPTGNYSSNLPNLFLKPFTLTEAEVGAELKFFHNRLGIDVSYFNRKTKNEIQSANLSTSTGFSSTVVGTGSTLNRGLEVQVSATPVQAKNFSWNITVNMTNVKNKILETDENGNNVSLGTNRPNHGAATTAFIKGLPGPQILVHDYKYDAKGNIVVDASGLPESGNVIPMGSVLPTLYGGVNNELTYKSFNLSFLFDYNYGNKILSATKFYTVYRGLDKMTLEGRETGITVGVHEDGSPNTTAASAQSYYQALAQNVQKISVLDGDYIKLRQITLGYNISEKVFANVPVFRSVTLSLVARNLLTLLKHTDNIDPEASFGSNVAYAGIEGTSLPSTRTFGINANFKFK
ncbi:SusC/RagA family TonB-linked outer membrane protein [Segetibacter koreensis]|uniref:SusC/RagA family TonB-linked outer membrane protein n=1 Tax=Segetibacter koreensis TaxID=398037 RepID=UPI000360FECC|nr:SusC/RagA family TonB-linked outer membrane protein [Segetibacter koreensis]